MLETVGHMTERESSSSLKGKIAATLTGIACAEGSGGHVNFATPFVDDEGIDLMFFKRGGTNRVVLAQVKSRTMRSKRLAGGGYRAQVRKATFRPREGYFLLFVALDESGTGLHDTLWCVPSLEFAINVEGQSSERPVFVFQTRFESNDKWKPYRLRLPELPSRIDQYLSDRRCVHGF